MSRNTRTTLLKSLLAKGFVITPGDVGGRRCPLVISDGAAIGFVPLPSDHKTPLTEAQLNSLFPAENRPAFVRAVAEIARQKAAQDAA